MLTWKSAQPARQDPAWPPAMRQGTRRPGRAVTACCPSSAAPGDGETGGQPRGCLYGLPTPLLACTVQALLAGWMMGAEGSSPVPASRNTPCAAVPKMQGLNARGIEDRSSHASARGDPRSVQKRPGPGGSGFGFSWHQERAAHNCEESQSRARLMAWSESQVPRGVLGP